MAVVIGAGRQRVREQASAGPNSRLSRSDNRAALGGVGARELLQSSDQLQAIAQREEEQLQKKVRSKMLSDLADFETSTRERTLQISSELSSEDSLVEPVMSDLETRAEEFSGQYPEFLQEELQSKLLRHQTQIAKNAVSEEAVRVESNFLREADNIAREATNKVRFGQTDEQTALQNFETYVADMPEGLQEVARVKGREAIRGSSLSSTVDSDPAEALRLIQEGEYNDLPTNVLESNFNAANRTILKQRKESAKLLRGAIEDRLTDPALAATKLLQSQGNSAPEVEQLLEAQAQLGIPKAKQSVLTKSQAKQAAFDLKSATTVDEFYAIREEKVQRIKERGASEDRVLNDMIRHGGMHPALEVAFSSDPAITPPEFVDAAIQLSRDSALAAQSKENIRRASDNPSITIEEISDSAFTAVADRVDVMFNSGMDSRQVNRFSKTVEDMTFVMYDRLSAEGRQDEIGGILRESFAQEAVVNDMDVVGSYVVPQELDLEMPAPVMLDLKDRLIDSANLLVPSSFVDRETGRQSIRSQSRWVMEDSNSLVLESNGQPVLWEDQQGNFRPFVFSYDDMYRIAAVDDNEGGRSIESVPEIRALATGQPFAQGQRERSQVRDKIAQKRAVEAFQILMGN